MLARLVIIAACLIAVYWYWQGPYQTRVNPSYEESLQKNEADMASCLRGKAYRLGTTGTGTEGDQAEEACAQELNLYFEDGRWHSHDRINRG